MAKNNYMWVLRDEYHTPISIASSKETAKRELEVLAKFTEWNRHFTIKEIRDTIIYFENHNYIDIVELPYCGTKKDFKKHFDFVEDYSNFK